MRRFRNTKILATLGPASSDKDTIRALFDAGADVFRLNFSHGSHEDHRKRYDTVRAVEAETGRPIGILADMQGPKLRIGTFADGRVVLKNGDRFVLDRDPAPGDVTRVHLPHPELYAAAAPGNRCCSMTARSAWPWKPPTRRPSSRAWSMAARCPTARA